LAQVSNIDALASLTGLSIKGISDDQENDYVTLRALVDSPPLHQLRALELDQLYPDTAAFEALSASPLLNNLSALSIWNNAGDWPDNEVHWGQLLREDRWYQLTTLRLNEPTVTDLMLIDSDHFPSLDTIEVVGLSEPELTQLFACHRLMGQLSSLTLRSCNITASVMRSLAHCEQLARLKRLELTTTAMTTRVLHELHDAPFHPTLQSLILDNNPLGDEGWKELATWYLPALTRLDLRNTGGCDPGYLALASSQGLPHLSALDLSRNHPTSIGAKCLADAIWLASLNRLELSPTRPTLGDEGICAILSSPRVRNLVELGLSDAGIGAKAVQALAGCAARLQSLNLSSNDVGTEGIAVLAQSEILSNIKYLNLSLCKLRDEGAALLAHHLSTTALRTLLLTGNQLTSTGIAYFATSPIANGIWELYLDFNRIGSDGISALVSSPYLRQLIELNLSSCWIDSRSACAFLMSPVSARLERVPAGITLDPSDLQQLQSVNCLRPIASASLSSYLKH
jgi:hypothetical protein